MAQTFGFLGAGKMAEAIVAGMLRAEIATPEDIVLCDRVQERLNDLSTRYGVGVTPDPAVAADASSVFFLAVKPQDAAAALEALRPHLTEDCLLISIAAGKTLASLRRHAGDAVRLIRVMPNLALAVGEGMSAYTPDENATDADCDLVESIFGAVGAVSEVPESEFDAVTALSGSGPAFFAWLMRAMADAAESAGLVHGIAEAFALQTMLGTALYLTEKEQHPDDFIRAVCSPKGTTEAGMNVLENSQIACELQEVIAAAAARSRELAE